MAEVDKAGPSKSVRANEEDRRIIEAVQKFHGVNNFSAMVLHLFREEHKRLGLEKV